MRRVSAHTFWGAGIIFSDRLENCHRIATRAFALFTQTEIETLSHHGRAKHAGHDARGASLFRDPRLRTRPGRFTKNWGPPGAMAAPDKSAVVRANRPMSAERLSLRGGSWSAAGVPVRLSGQPLFFEAMRLALRFPLYPPKADIVRNVRLVIMSFEAPPGKRSMFGYLTIDLLNSVRSAKGSSLSLTPANGGVYCVSLTAGLLGQE